MSFVIARDDAWSEASMMITRDDASMVREMFLDVHREILQSRKEILDYLFETIPQEDDVVRARQPYPSSVQIRGPGFQGPKDINEQQWQQDFDSMKQTFVSIQQDVQSLKVQMSDYRWTSPQLQFQSRFDSKEAADHGSAGAINMMTDKILADLQTMQRQNCQEICDFIGSRIQTLQQGGPIQSMPPVPEAKRSGFQSSANLSQDGLESLRTFIQQEFQSLKDSLVSEVRVSSKDPPAMVPAEALHADNGEEPDDSTGDGKDRLIGDVWEDFQVSVNRYEEQHNAYQRILDRVHGEGESLWHGLFRHYGLYNLLDTEMPNNSLAKFTTQPLFNAFQTILILSNTAIMGYESDCAIKAALQDPRGEEPAWLSTCNLAFNLVFTLELLFRIVALRSWFWVSPKDWGWNAFDVAVVGSSLTTDMMGGVNFSFIRTFRILRAVRAVRVIRVLRFFRELRKILLSILACLGSLFWCFVFLAMTMFMFTILTLQGIVDALDSMDPSSQEHKRASDLARTWYASLGESMFTLLAAFTSGDDFFAFHEPIEPAGFLYSAAYVLYMLFVMVGVMNVLTGVFLAASQSFTDRSLLVQGEKMEEESFVLSMLEVFEECDIDRSGSVTWQEFSEALKEENLQAFLAAHKFEVTHARLIFDVLDDMDTGQVNLLQFVMGMLRLKGEAKAVDARIIQRLIGMIPKLLNRNMLNDQYKHRKAHHV